MKSTVRNMYIPAIVNGYTIGTATFTVMAAESPTKDIAIVKYGERFIGEREFAAGTGCENVMATIQNLLTPEPFFHHS